MIVSNCDVELAWVSLVHSNNFACAVQSNGMGYTIALQQDRHFNLRSFGNG